MKNIRTHASLSRFWYSNCEPSKIKKRKNLCVWIFKKNKKYKRCLKIYYTYNIRGRLRIILSARHTHNYIQYNNAMPLLVQHFFFFISKFKRERLESEGVKCRKCIIIIVQQQHIILYMSQSRRVTIVKGLLSQQFFGRDPHTQK